MSYEKVKQASKCVVGTKQTLKAIQQQQVLEIIVATDADTKVTAPVIQVAEQQGIPVSYVDSKKKLGKTCGIEVAASVVAITK